MSVKLYRVKIRSYGDYQVSYVVAANPEEAYQEVKTYLDNENLCFPNERELDQIELMAEETQYPKCKTHLFVT